MDKYLTIFKSHSQYVEPEVRPNVSYCIQEDEVHYNPSSIMTVRYNVIDASQPTQLYYYYANDGITGALMFNNVEIDEVNVSITDLDTAEGMYQLSVGEHTVKYTLKNSMSIGESAFKECANLTSVTIPNSVTSIGDNAFYYCTGLTSVHITDLAAWCKITFGDNPLHYAHHLFLNGEEINDLVIPNSVTSIGEAAFNQCYGLTSVTIPNSVTSIESDAFSNCRSLSSITIPDSVISLGKSAFYACISLTSVTIPNSVTTIGESAFNRCTGLTSVTFGNSVTSIGNSAFQGCTSLTSVIIGNSVSTIEGWAFWNCSGLTSITIPNSVTSIGDGAFSNCGGLTSIICNATTAPTIASKTFRDVKTNGTLTVPSGSSGYDAWMGTGNYYLGKYNWTKVEQ